jgi:hypothetical protein
VASVVVTMLLLIRFLDSPFHEGVGGVRPVAMERTMRLIASEFEAVNLRVQLPCDAMGRPT